MAGVNKKIRSGDVLFRNGDPSDGMYLVRSGEMIVYLEQNGAEVVLAKVPAGGMIGEMALFDQKPRSASVKASAESEVTLISLDDFNKLMKQIPRWFVGLMVTLSTRLRSTNERLKDLEAKQILMASAFATYLKILNLLNLLWQANATKVGKDWMLDAKETKETITKIFGIEGKALDTFFQTLIEKKFLDLKKDEYNNETLSIQNRGNIPRFIEFISHYLKQVPGGTGLSGMTIKILGLIQKMTLSSAYEQFSISLDELGVIVKKEGFPTDEIPPALKELSISGGEIIKLVKQGDGSAVLRVIKKDLPVFVQFHSLITALLKSKNL